MIDNSGVTSPVIGLSCTLDGGRYSVPKDYIGSVRAAGGYPFVIPLPQSEDEAEKLLMPCSGLLLTGGVDADPSLYGEYRQYEEVSVCPPRDKGEYALISAAVKLRIPILGICRGIQMINVYFGGTLYQDIPFQIRNLPGGGNPHRQTESFPAGGHTVTFEKELWPVSKKTIRVNSYHHQAIKQLAPGFQVLARDDTDGLVEAICSPGTPSRPLIMAVQWHPELIRHLDQDHDAIFRFFVDKAREVVL